MYIAPKQKKAAEEEGQFIEGFDTTCDGSNLAGPIRRLDSILVIGICLVFPSALSKPEFTYEASILTLRSSMSRNIPKSSLRESDITNITIPP